MHCCDALIVGGGPAGSTCARILRLAGWNVIVLDRERFPRDKVCAGWLTPAVLSLLDLSADEYRATGFTFQEIRGFRTGIVGEPTLETAYDGVVSYAIRRCEFDHFLLRRAGVRVFDGMTVATIARRGGLWVVNDRFESPVIVGAGGHFCPVARHLQRGPDPVSPVVAKELEFRLGGVPSSVAEGVPELFFSRDLEGYGWCVRKGDYLNVGLGRRDRGDFAAHLHEFAGFLAATGRARDLLSRRWRGHAYHARGAGVRQLVARGALVAGDAAGLAYPESGEGIRPAIESGRLAAETLAAAGGRRAAEDLQPYAETMRARHPVPAQLPPSLQPLTKAVGRALLRRSRAFTRRVVLDSWFLRGAGEVALRT